MIYSSFARRKTRDGAGSIVTHKDAILPLVFQEANGLYIMFYLSWQKIFICKQIWYLPNNSIYLLYGVTAHFESWPCHSEVQFCVIGYRDQNNEIPRLLIYFLEWYYYLTSSSPFHLIKPGRFCSKPL
mgnify:CR=1 FL=1